MGSVRLSFYTVSREYTHTRGLTNSPDPNPSSDSPFLELLLPPRAESIVWGMSLNSLPAQGPDRAMEATTVRGSGLRHLHGKEERMFIEYVWI